MTPHLPTEPLNAEDIFRLSHSSFSPAFRFLPKGRRDDLKLLYAFCRIIDDIADTDTLPIASRSEAMKAWRSAFQSPNLASLPHNLRSLIQQRPLPAEFFLELIDGATTDLTPALRILTRADLDLYCHRVAGIVGRLCLPIFGADPIRSADYAETLGRALQYTNILRDTASDITRNRLYFPQEELSKHSLNFDNFLVEHAPRQNYLRSFAEQALQLFRQAASLLPSKDHKALLPARVMSATYLALLQKMLRDNLQVTAKRYHLSRWEKITAAGSALF